MTKEKIDTVEKVLRYSVNQHGEKIALGTREILAEENEVQSNGRVFKKVLLWLSLLSKYNVYSVIHTDYFMDQVILGDYKWRTFNETNIEAEQFGRGLRELGLQAKENVVIFAETRAEWLLVAHGCMKQNIPLVTLYATLDDEAVVQAINETDVACVVTSHELLPKFKKILHSTPKVTTLVNILCSSFLESEMERFVLCRWSLKINSFRWM